MLGIVPFSEGASPALWMALRLLEPFSWDKKIPMSQRNQPKNVFPGRSDWYTGIDTGSEVALLPTTNALRRFINAWRRILQPWNRHCWTRTIGHGTCIRSEASWVRL